MATECDINIPREFENIFSEGLPIFPIANKENRLLAEELAKKKKKIQDLKSKISDHEKLNAFLETHHTDVIKEISSLKQIYQSRKQEIETGENVHNLILRERSWLEKQTKILDKETNSCKERQENYRISIDDLIRKKEKIRNDLQTDQENVKKWSEDSAKTEEDIEILEKYKFMNNARVREMEIKIENANNNSKHWKTLANEINLEISSMQAELYRSGVDFRQAHKQRKEVLSQIEKGIEKIQKKDDEINKLVSQLDDVKQEIVCLEENIIDKKSFMEKYIRENKDLEKMLMHSEQELESIRYELVCIQKQIDDSNSELEAKRLIVNNMTAKLSQMRNEKHEKENQIEEKQMYLERVVQEKEKLDKDLQELKENDTSEEKCLQQLEDNVHKAEIKYNQEQKALDIISSSKLKTFKELEECRLKEKLLLNDMKTMASDIKNIKQQKSQDEVKLSQYQEELYKLDYQILKLEQRMKYMEGDTSKQDELVHLKSTLQKLKKIHEERKTSLDFLNTHVHNNREEIYRLNKKLQKAKSDQNNALNKLQEINLSLSSTKNALKSAIAEKEELIVEECILNVKLKQIQQLLSKKSEEVFNIQKEKLQLEENVKQQMEELNTRKNILKTEIRQSDLHRQTLTNKLNKYCIKIDRLQTRYKCVLNVLGLKEDDERKEVDLLVDAETEKAKIRNEIYEKAEVVKKMSEEVKGLKNSLVLIKATNIVYRQLTRPKEDDNVRRINQMRTKKKQLEKKLFEKKIELKIAQEKMDSVRVENENLQSSFQELQNILIEKSHTLNKTRQKLSEQHKKLNRCDSINSNLCQKAKNSNDNAVQQINDVKIKLLRNVNKRVMDFVKEICEKYPEVYEKLRKLFLEASLPFPIKLFRRNSNFSYSSTSNLTKLSSPARTLSKCSSRTSNSERKEMITNLISLEFDANKY